MSYRRPPSTRKPGSNRLLTVDDIYRQPVGPATHTKSLYALLLRFVKRNWSQTTLKVQTHHSYCFIYWAAERGLYLLPGLKSQCRHPVALQDNRR